MDSVAASPAGGAAIAGLVTVPANVPVRIKLDTTATPYRLFFANGPNGAWVLAFSDLPAGEYCFAACLHVNTTSLTLGTCPP